MRVVAINTVADAHNAPGRIMTEICRAVNNSGGESLLVYGRGTTPVGIKSYRVGGNVDVLLHTIKSRLTDSEGLHSRNNTFRLIKEIEQFGTDIVHLHNLHGHYLNIPILFDWLKKSQIPVVWTLHDCWAFTGHCAYYSTCNCDLWHNGCQKCKYTKEYPRSYISQSRRNYELKKELFTSLDNMTIVPVSQWLAGEVALSFLNKYKQQVIYNGIDTNEFVPDNFSTENYARFKILGVASNWENRKNLQFFIDLSEQLFPDEKIVIVGSLSRTQKRLLSLRQIVYKDVVTDSRELSDIYASCDIFINPSRAETFGMTTIEAMSCGLPVIVNNATALPEIIANNNGYAVDINDISLVRNTINEIRNASHNYKSICRNHVQVNYSLNAMTEQYKTLYNTIINKNV